MKHVLKIWLPLAGAIIVLSLTAYGLVQQSARMSANDPQLQMARDGAALLTAGAVPASVVPRTGDFVNLNTSLAPFIAVYDDAGIPLESSGVLDNKPPKLPAGVFTYTREHGEDIVTWQPKNGVRIAAVIVRSGGAHPRFVVAGRSLAEVERRAETLFELTLVGCIAAMAASFALLLLFARD